MHTAIYQNTLLDEEGLIVLNGGADQVTPFPINDDGSLGQNDLQPGSTQTVPNATPSTTAGATCTWPIRDAGMGGTYAFRILSSSVVVPVEGSPFGGSGAAIAVTPNGKFVYVLSPDATVSGLAIDGPTGALTPIAGAALPAGQNPTAIVIDAAGRFAYVPDVEGGTIFIYALDANSGAITPAGTVDVPGVVAIALRPPL